jgi:hypothetical protein
LCHSCHDPEDWLWDGPPWLWPTEGPDCVEPTEGPDCVDPDDEEPSDEDPDESVPFDEEPLPFDESSEDEEPDELLPDDDDPVVPEVPEVAEPMACEPEKSMAEAMPAAARLDSPTIDVTFAATLLPADRESIFPPPCRAIRSRAMEQASAGRVQAP